MLSQCRGCSSSPLPTSFLSLVQLLSVHSLWIISFSFLGTDDQMWPLDVDLTLLSKVLLGEFEDHEVGTPDWLFLLFGPKCAALYQSLSNLQSPAKALCRAATGRFVTSTSIGEMALSLFPLCYRTCSLGLFAHFQKTALSLRQPKLHNVS